MTRKHLLEAGTLVVAAVLCALVANGLAGRERKLALAGVYPNALRVPPEPSSTPVPQIMPAAAASPATEAIPLATGTTPTAASASHAPIPAIQPAPASAMPVSAPSKPGLPAASPPSAARPAAPQPKSDLARFAVHPEQPYVEIGYDDVAALHDANVLFLDARRTSVFEQGHISGARPVSVWEADVDDKVRKLFDERGDQREQARPIVIYCSGGDCEDSHMLAQKLWGIQFNNLYVYKDGFPDWQKRGGAIHTGSNP